MADLTGKILGPYRILEQIGQGGMATVYKAYHLPTDRYVAAKVLSPETANDAQFMRRFDREAKAIASLQHIHILPVFDYGQHEGVPYLVMRYVPTGTLKDRLVEGPLSVDEVVRLFCQIAEAVDYAHQRGILHRDLKPANVLLDDSGNALLSDFGLARLIGSSSSLTGINVVGTPLYMSPAQGQGKEIDARSDIYSLGVILYEMLGGAPPFTAETPVAVIFKHISETPPSLRARRPDLPDAVERVVLKALAKKPDERFQTAGEMATALRKAAGIQPPSEAKGPAQSEEDLLPTYVAAVSTSASTQPPPVRASVALQPAQESLPPAEYQPRRLTMYVLSRWRRIALAALFLIISLAVVMFARGVLVSAVLHDPDRSGAGTMLDAAAFLGVDVNGDLRKELLQALDGQDTERMIQLAERYAERVPNDAGLSAEIQSRARSAAAAGQQPATKRLVQVLVILDPQAAAALAGEFNDAGVAALLHSPPQESLARAYLDAVRYLDETLVIGRSNSEQSISLYNQAQAKEGQSGYGLAVEIYREAVRLDSSNLAAYYALSSLLLTQFVGDPASLDEAVQVAHAGVEHIDPRYCRGTQDLSDPDTFEQSWLCFLLLTTEAGARIMRGDASELSMPLVERAIQLAEDNDHFGTGYYTAEAYYYLARLTEPDTDADVLCEIISHHNRDSERHRQWAIYANEQLHGRQCLPDS